MQAVEHIGLLLFCTGVAGPYRRQFLTAARLGAGAASPGVCRLQYSQCRVEQAELSELLTNSV